MMITTQYDDDNDGMYECVCVNGAQSEAKEKKTAENFGFFIKKRKKFVQIH